jgi:hypothetical protein
MLAHRQVICVYMLIFQVSYGALERVLRALGAFYSKAGPDARVTDELRQQLLQDLDLAEKSV